MCEKLTNTFLIITSGNEYCLFWPIMAATAGARLSFSALWQQDYPTCKESTATTIPKSFDFWDWPNVN